MPTDTGWITATGASKDYFEGVVKEKGMTRSRYLDLTRIAIEVCASLEKRGIKKHEGCTFRRIAEEVWRLQP